MTTSEEVGPDLGPFTAAPGAAGIFVDFDGTLSEIVKDPGDAVPVDGAPEVLAALAADYGRVAVLSGRPVGFIDGFFAKEVVLSGLYGLEVVPGAYTLCRGSFNDFPTVMRYFFGPCIRIDVPTGVVRRNWASGPGGGLWEGTGDSNFDLYP